MLTSFGRAGSIVVWALCACGGRTPLGVVVDVGADAEPADASVDVRDASRDAPSEAASCPFALLDTVAATMEITADDAYVLYVDGALVDGTVRPWTTPQTYELTLLRHPKQRNVIAIAGTNQMNTTGRDRGVIADVRLTPNMTEVRIVTDTAWRVSKQPVPNWFTVGFDASAWPKATDEGPYGEPPWGSVLPSPTTAHWLWTYDSNLPADQKVVAETAYFRREFYLDMAGNPRDTPGPCP